MHVFMKVLDNIFLGISFNIDMSIILHTQITIVGNNLAIIQLLSIDDDSSTIISLPIFDKPNVFNACLIVE